MAALNRSRDGNQARSCSHEAIPPSAGQGGGSTGATWQASMLATPALPVRATTPRPTMSGSPVLSVEQEWAANRVVGRKGSRGWASDRRGTGRPCRRALAGLGAARTTPHSPRDPGYARLRTSPSCNSRNSDRKGSGYISVHPRRTLASARAAQTLSRFNRCLRASLTWCATSSACAMLTRGACSILRMPSEAFAHLVTRPFESDCTD